jgi:TolB protein
MCSIKNFRWIAAYLLTTTVFIGSAHSAAAPQSSAPPEPATSVEKTEPFRPSSSKVYIPVGSARAKKSIIAFPAILAQGDAAQNHSKTISEIVDRDLVFMDLFKFLDPAAFTEDSSKAGITPGTFKYSDWTQIKAEFLVKSSVSILPSRSIALEAYLYDTFGAKQVFAKRYVAPVSDIKSVAHSFANDIVHALTGLPGIFLTKIAMSCDMTGKKEIYFMNYDGTDVKQVTRHRSISFSPAWSPDGSRLAYSVYTRHSDNNKNIDLYEHNFLNSTVRMLSSRKGINSGAAYSPDGKELALTISTRYNPQIHVMNLATRAVTKITKSLGFDVDPSWSPDGKQIAFVSSRAGMPMVFSMKADGSQVQRLTYAGRYNATPSWSSQNNKISFAGWIDKSFDIFIMNPDGSNIERLTKNQGSNEDPFFSPDGNFIVFSSNRTGQKNIYVMNVDGTFVKRLTYGLGNCVSPKWSNPPKVTTTDVQK